LGSVAVVVGGSSRRRGGAVGGRRVKRGRVDVGTEPATRTGSSGDSPTPPPATFRGWRKKTFRGARRTFARRERARLDEDLLVKAATRGLDV